jgi:hypothetical protein
MKHLLLIPMILFTACATHSPKANSTASAAVPVGKPVSSDSLRTDEQLKEYRLGRYVDLRDPLVMHEAHPTYRVEAAAHWDLRPQTETTIPQRKTTTAPSVSTNDAVVAEVNKQRAATRAFTEQAATLNQKLTELSKVVSQTEEVVKDNASLQKDIADLREQLDARDAQLNQPKPTPSPSPEDKW